MKKRLDRQLDRDYVILIMSEHSNLNSYWSTPCSLRLLAYGVRSDRTAGGWAFFYWSNAMGYSHYWDREKVIAQKTFGKISTDAERVCIASKLPLGDGWGENKPIFTDELIELNGSTSCGHEKNTNITIPWPSSNAGGVYEPGDSENPISGSWFTGAELQTRVCDGDCSYETFKFPRIYKPENCFNFTKTAFRPYDLVVTACLIIAKHYLGNKITIYSDGDSPQWFDGAMLCHKTLGYGLCFHLDCEKQEV